MKFKILILLLISSLLVGCVGVSSKGIFGTGVSVALDPRSLGTQIDDSIMQKNLSARILILDKKYFLSSIKILADKFFCIIESSIWVPKDLGSSATDTPVPKIPFEETPMQLDKNKLTSNNINILYFIFNF